MVSASPSLDEPPISWYAFGLVNLSGELLHGAPDRHGSVAGCDGRTPGDNLHSNRPACTARSSQIPEQPHINEHHTARGRF